jgi:hypothetical protein
LFAPEEPRYAGVDRTCPVCGWLVWKRVAPGSCAIIEHLDEAGAVTSGDVEDVTEEHGEVYFECEDGHAWVEETKEIVIGAESAPRKRIYRRGEGARQ